MNSVHLVGNLTRDPEFRALQNGGNVCRFTVTCQRKYRDANGQYQADFISCVAWRQTAEFVHKYFLKGQRIGVNGTIQTRTYDAQDGTKRYVTEVVAEDVEFVTPKGDAARGAAPTPHPEGGDGSDGQDYEAQHYPPPPTQEQMYDEEDELPF